MHSRQTDSAVTIFAIVPNRLLFGMMLQCHLEIQNPCGNTIIFLPLACTYCLLSAIAEFNHEATPGLSTGPFTGTCNGRGENGALLSLAAVTGAEG